MRSLLKNSIRDRLRLFALVAVSMPLVLAFGILVLVTQDRIEERHIEEMRDNLAFMQNYVNDWLEEELTDIVFLSQLPEFNPPRSRDVLIRILNDFVTQNPGVASASLLNATGRTVVDTAGMPDRDLAHWQFFLDAWAGKANISEAIKAKRSQRPIILFSAPVRESDGSFAGVVTASVHLERITEDLTQLRLGLSGDNYILDQNGRVLGRPAGKILFDLEDTVQGELPRLTGETMETLRRARDGIIFESTSGGDLYVRSVEANDGEWLLVTEMSRAEVLEPFWDTLEVLGLGLVLTLAVVLPLLLSLSSSIARPLHDLANTARTLIEKGHEHVTPAPPERTAPLEVKMLYEAFNAMLGTIRETISSLEQASVTDQLTGVANRRRLSMEAKRLISTQDRLGQPLACVMLDLDHFKHINDQHGHAAGDAVLKGFADLLQRTLRGSDMLVRMGGEAFAVIAPNTSVQEACLLAERIRASLEETAFSHEGQELRITVSAGCSMRSPGEPRELEIVLAEADQALYEAKQQGRNRVVCRDTPKAAQQQPL